MIVEWLLCISLIWVRPNALSLFNPFFLLTSSYFLERRFFLALVTAYCSGLLRDIFLATPRFGMLGASSLFASIITLGICFYFPLEGFIGSCILLSFLTLFDLLFSAYLGSLFCGYAFFSLKTLFLAFILSFVWISLCKGIPSLLQCVSIRRRRRDSNS